MTKSEFELARYSNKYLLKEIYKSYLKSIDPKLIKHFKDNLDEKFIDELRKHESIYACFKYILGLNISFFFIENLKEMGYDIDEVLDDLNVYKSKDYDRSIGVIWSLQYRDLKDSFNIYCEDVFKIFSKRYPTLILYMCQIKLHINW